MNHTDIANYADDNTPYVSGNEVVRFLEESSRVIFKWFSDSQFQAKATKCHVLLSTDQHAQVNIGAAQIENNSKILSVTIDVKLSFEKRIEQIYAQTRAKLKASARIVPFMNIQKKKVLIKAFFTAQFSNCPLIWMFQRRKLTNKINKLHEHCLWIAYSDNTSSFEELLETDNSVSVHHRNIQALPTELHKIVNGLPLEIMKEEWLLSFNKNTTYHTRNKKKFHSRVIKLMTFGSETLSHLPPKLWEFAPVEIENVESVACFKRVIKKWKPINCPCRHAGRMFFMLV